MEAFQMPPEKGRWFLAGMRSALRMLEVFIGHRADRDTRRALRQVAAIIEENQRIICEEGRAA